MTTFAVPFSGFAHSLEITGAIPAIDHHSHAAYVRPGETLAPFDSLETEVVAGYVEARIPADEYQRFVSATRSNNVSQAREISERYGIEKLRNEAKPLYATTAFSRALAIGCDALYGEGTREFQLARATDRLKDYRALYDDALRASNTESVLTDVPSLDQDAWPSARYRQIGRIDAYLYPFGHDPYTGRGFDAQRFATILSEKLAEELQVTGLEKLPESLEDYERFVRESLSRRRTEGLAGLKIVSAYVRSLDFATIDVRDAREAYEALRLADPESAHPRQRKLLSDYLVGVIAHHAIKLDLPLQIHCGIGHSEPGLRISGANPLLLEEFLNQPTLNRLRVVLIHGGYPYSSQLGALAHSLGNVYLDFSWMPYLHSHLTYRVLQEWIEFLPAHKVAYGTDTAHPEIHVGATMLAREQLERVLQDGLETRVWTAAQASMLAERVLRTNVADLYDLP